MTEKNTTETAGNPFGYVCPVCGKGDGLYATASMTVSLATCGTDATDSDTEWDGNAPAWCGCGWTGKVNEFAQAENFEEE
jgi:hypothetical protein